MYEQCSRGMLSKAISTVLIILATVVLLSQDLAAQFYELTLNQRRRYDQIHVEIWARRISANATQPGYASLVVQYNSDFLIPSTTQIPGTTDSLNHEINQTNPIVNITSPYNNINGYKSLTYQNYSGGFYSLELNLVSIGEGGFIADSTGRGSLVGKLIFDIVNDPDDTVKTGIEWSKSQTIGKTVVFDTDSTELTTNLTFLDPGSFDLIGITILSPNFDGQVVDRDKNYASLSTRYAGGGYPVYFERSVSPQKYLPPSKPTLIVDSDLSYLLDYSLDNGNIWTEIGRVAETEKDATQFGNNLKYRSGEIFNPNTGGAFTITSIDGTKITDTNYRKPVRVIWAKSPLFIERSEQAKIKITILAGTSNDNLTAREESDVNDISDGRLVLGRLFFLQLNGSTEYLKTQESFSNSTQLTVAAWVNLNSLNAIGSEPAIIASSLGADATPINGSVEGAWMLYFKDGRFPAFRVRETLGRGTNGYIASLADVIPFTSATSVAPIADAHSKNWMHIAATVNNNEVTLYVNGEIVDKTTNLNATDIRMLTTNHPLWIGVNPNTSIEATDFLQAGIKEVQIWRTALTQEEIRQRVAGIVEPTDVADYGDLRRGLDIYYSLEGTLDDLANEKTMQKGSQSVNLVRSNVISTSASAINYRPDQPHIKLTAPTADDGVLNKEGEEFEIRWVSYGMGDIATAASKDVEIEYSLDNGNTWFFAKSPKPVDLSGTNAPDIELFKTRWEPWENNNVLANLRSINPYAHTTLLRIRGTSARQQQGLMDVSAPFTVARYFSLFKTQGTVLSLDGKMGMNITGDNFYIESWIRPHRFPTVAEGFWTILSKHDSTTNTGHYNLRLLPTGQIQFNITDAAGVVRTANSDLSMPIISPNSIAIDTPWTHIGVYVARNGGTASSEIRFYIDGTVQRIDSISQQLGTNLTVNALNSFPTFIGYQPGTNINSFIGEMRELRFWNGTPNNATPIGNEPTPMTLFMQGALNVRADELTLNNHQNLAASFSFNGKSFIHNGYSRAVGSETNTSAWLRLHGKPYAYRAVKPYIKLVEPVFKQKVANTKNDIKVRWVGFDYNGEGFSVGTANLQPSLEFSIRGGGGNIIQPYQYLGSKFWSTAQVPSISYPATDTFMFNKIGRNIDFAARVDFSKADPDVNNDGKFDDQGAIAASLTNARLRLKGNFTINAQSDTIMSEGPLFSITPATNFTVRVLLEGYHDGNIATKNITNLPSAFDGGGLKIKIYSDNAGTLGALLDSAESTEGYDERNPANLNKENKRFANVNFVFTDLADGNYWVIVDQLNHLPVMSRFPAPFIYEGDERTSWKIESGWDFSSWNGADENIMKSYSIEPWIGNLFSAFGDAYSSVNNTRYSTTGLVYNNGRGGAKTTGLASMVGGDVTQDNQINAADRVRVRLDEGTSLIRSDVTGDGVVNADDRTIVDRNFGKVSSVYNVNIPLTLIGEESGNPFSINRSDKNKNENEITNNFPSVNYVMDNKYDETQAVSYIVRAVPERKGDTINLPMYIRNNGFDFGLANATFAVEYNSSAINFSGLAGWDSVMFSNDTVSGYARLRTSPTDNVQNPIPNVRTIEVDYDATDKFPGKLVPRNFTYLGTLQFLLKQKKGVVMFTWHSSKSVHSTDSLVITDDGIFEDIEPLLLYSAIVNYPNGGEEYGSGKQVKIMWNSDGEAQVFPEYTTNAGINWIRLSDEAIDVKKGFENWITPGIFSSNYMIRLVDALSGKEIDRSNDKFSIIPNLASVQHPAAFDPIYRGGGIDSIVWTSQGYDKVLFEFSPDGGINWESITPILDAQKGNYSWKLPEVTTKTAKIRMLEADSNEQIAITGNFRILTGTMQFRSPKKNEVIYNENETRISWNSSDITTFDLQLSLNGGLSWSLLESDLTAYKWNHNWNIPAGMASDNAMLKAIWNGDDEMVYGQSEVFSIKTEPTKVEDVLPSGYEVGLSYPNPSIGIAKIKMNLPKDNLIGISIVNLDGRTVKVFESKNYNAGKLDLEIPLNGITQGKYFLKINGNYFSAVREIVLIK